MSMRISRELVILVAIVLVALLETVAILKGIDGKGLAIAFAIIGLLAPSPVYTLKVFKLLEVQKGGESNAAVSDRPSKDKSVSDR
jgi:hypothetical protein